MLRIKQKTYPEVIWVCFLLILNYFIAMFLEEFVEDKFIIEVFGKKLDNILTAISPFCAIEEAENRQIPTPCPLP